MAHVELKEIWTAAAVLMGFQVTAFIWRLNRETTVAEAGGVNWVPPADYLSLCSLLVAAYGVYASPIAGLRWTLAPEHMLVQCLSG
jgi:hypothetical protein